MYILARLFRLFCPAPFQFSDLIDVPLPCPVRAESRSPDPYGCRLAGCLLSAGGLLGGWLSPARSLRASSVPSSGRRRACACSFSLKLTAIALQLPCDRSPSMLSVQRVNSG